MKKNKISVLSVFGTRPEAIKMAPLVKALAACPQIDCKICVTGQHRQMLDQVLSAFSIKPDFDLNIMEPRQTLTGITTRSLTGLEPVLRDGGFDLVLVHGDTTTSLSAALAAFYAGVRVGHVEAGLRSDDRHSPYPEEMNRRMIGTLADLHFAPTAQNRENLRRESITQGVFVTGNTAIDALRTTVRADHRFACQALNDLGGRRLVLLTAHRRENYGQPMENILSAVRTLAQDYRDLLFVYPVHLSPYVSEAAHRCLSNLENVLLIEPLGVLDMHNLMARAHFVMTDSGGLQEEAPSLGKPVLVLRRETERQEAVDAGTVKLCGTEYDDILACARLLIEDPAAYARMAKAVNPYGDGGASARIVHGICHAFGLEDAPPADFC